jgi:hypothetical protein
VRRSQKLRLTYGAVFLAGVFAGAVASVGSVSGHIVSLYYGPEWSGDRAYGVGWLASTPNTASGVSTISGSVLEWNSVSATFEFTPYQGRNTSVSWTGSGCTTGYPNQVWSMSSDTGSSLAVTHRCSSGGSVLRAAIRIDTRLNWDVDGGTTPANLWDLRSVMVHEYGHATGFGGGTSAIPHFEEDDVFCDAGIRHTMCPSTSIGAIYWRSLELHDEHTFDGAY